MAVDPCLEMKMLLVKGIILHDVVDFVLEDLTQLLSHSSDLIPPDKKDLLASLYENYGFINTFLKYSAENFDEDEDGQMQHLVRFIKLRGMVILTELNSFITILKDESTREQTDEAFNHNLRDLIGTVEEQKAMVIVELFKSLNVILVPQAKVYSDETWSRVKNHVLGQEDTLFVGFEDEERVLIDRLTITQKQLEVISIVGMPGLGKTTLAKKVYHNSYIHYYFYTCGWTYVSQVYHARCCLLSLLNNMVERKDEIEEMSEHELGRVLYQFLKGKRYLIVLDDVWNIESLNDLRKYFPNDNNGSKILLTTRQGDLAQHIKPYRHPHSLRFLNETESWDLFQQKAFGEGGCPRELMETGKQIASKCHGLPLAIVVVAGLAKNEITISGWQQIAANLSSHVMSDELVKDVLALSYRHLPYHLKRCFLYAGVYQEEVEISVWRLTWLWIAEGLIQKAGDKSLEDVAEGYLMNLIERCLVLVEKRRSNGRIKTCRIHNLLRDFCLSKMEMNTLESPNSQASTSSGPAAYFRRFFNSQVLYCAHLHVTLSDPDKLHVFKFLRVLVLSSIEMIGFPRSLLSLFNLRYLALKCSDIHIPSEISMLSNLETFIYVNRRQKIRVILPYTVLKMVKLRHLRIFPKMEIEIPSLLEVPTTDGSPSVSAKEQTPFLLENIQTITWLYISSYEVQKQVASDPVLREVLSAVLSSTKDVLARTPNLRKLGLFLLQGGYDFEGIPDLTHLNHLETLKFLNRSAYFGPPDSSFLIKFPPNLKHLDLAGGHSSWNDILILETLPNLETLTLENNCFFGPHWETHDGGFLRLKFLKLSWMDLEQWITSSSHFPSLQRLVLYACSALKEIPSELGDIATLQMIEVHWSSQSAANSAKSIQEEQRSMDNELQIYIHPSNEEHMGDLGSDEIKRKPGVLIMTGAEFLQKFGEQEENESTDL